MWFFINALNMVFCSRNAQVTFVKIPQLKIIKHHDIQFILDQTKLLRITLKIGPGHLHMEVHLKLR